MALEQRQTCQSICRISVRAYSLPAILITIAHRNETSASIPFDSIFSGTSHPGGVPRLFSAVFRIVAGRAGWIKTQWGVNVNAR